MKLNYFQGALYPWRFCVIVGLLLAMVGWKSLYALVMLAGLWLFLPRRPDKATLTPSSGL